MLKNKRFHLLLLAAATLLGISTIALIRSQKVLAAAITEYRSCSTGQLQVIKIDDRQTGGATCDSGIKNLVQEPAGQGTSIEFSCSDGSTPNQVGGTLLCPQGTTMAINTTAPIISGTAGSAASGCATKPTTDICHNVIIQNYIQPLINFLGIGFGLITTIMIVIGGVQYSAAGDNPQAVQAAKKRIFNAIFALVVFMLMYAFLQFLVPGGLF